MRAGFTSSSGECELKAMDGELGAALRKDLATATGFHVFEKELDVGFRQITTSTKPIVVADDLAGVKLRTPSGRIWVDCFKALGANVATISIGEVYTALQTHVMDGEENPYLIIETQRLYEVQKYLSVTNHMWSGQYFYCNGDAWRALPPDIREIVDRNAAIYARRQRADTAALNASLAEKLRRQGMIFNTARVDTFVAKLAPFYARQKTAFGPVIWSLLEKYTGPLGA